MNTSQGRQLHAQTVLISGGGIAGPALAYWLHKFGFTPIIVEQAEEVRTGGNRIDMFGVGVEALDRMGLLDAAWAAGGPGPEMVVYTGKKDYPVPIAIGDVDTTSPHRAGFAIKRGAMCELLYENVCDDVEYIFGDSITAITPTDEGVDVTFENSASRHVDLVIGADGMYSNVRSLIMGESANYSHYLGTNLVIFTLDNFLEMRDTMAWHFWPGLGCAISTFPGNSEAEGVFLIRTEKPLEVRDLTRTQRIDLVDSLIPVDGWHVPHLRRAMRDSEEFHISPSTQIRMDSWTNGRVALVGDAGYCPDPMTGQGTSLALAGAYILAGELKAAHGDHRTAFRAYETNMRPFVTASQQVGKFTTAFAAPAAGRTGVWMGEQAIRASFSLFKLAQRLGVPLPGAGSGNKLALATY